EQKDADQGARLELGNSLSPSHGSRARAALEGYQMGLLVDGHWTDRRYDRSASGGRFQRPESAFRNWVTPDGTPGSDRSGRLQGRARTLPPLCLARLPLGASNLDLSRPEGARESDLAVGRALVHGRGWLDLRQRPGRPS